MLDKGIGLMQSSGMSEFLPSQVFGIGTGAALALVIAACSPGTIDSEAASDVNPDPPEAAQALSLGNVAELESNNPSEASIDCAIALRITLKALQPMTSGNNSPEVRTMRAAIESYAKRAVNGDTPRLSVDAKIARGAAEKAEDKGGQAQVAVGCLNRLAVIND